MPADQVFYKWGTGVGASLPKIDRAYDSFLVTEEGEEIIDAAAGAAVVNLGHSLDGIEDVAQDQISSVSYLSLTKFTHRKTEELAERLKEITPAGLNTTFFTNSGSEANETCFKLARLYHQQKGNPHKSKIIGRWQSYHGATLGALSAGGNTFRRASYDTQLLNWPHIPPAYPYRWEYDGSPEEQARSAALELEHTIKQEGQDTVAAFVAEPISGASIPAAAPHEVYFQEIRRICDEYDVLFIADEVMTGFGRTGPLFGINHYDIVPDMLVLGKGLSSGYTPISASVVHDSIAAEFQSNSSAKFIHGHTHSGNPLSAAIALYATNQYTDDVLNNAQERGEQLRRELEPLADHEMVGDLRQRGLMLGIEFVKDTSTKQPFDPELGVYKHVYEEALNRGVYIYPGHGSVDGVAGDHVMISPPLTIEPNTLTTVASVVKEAIDSVHMSLR